MDTKNRQTTQVVHLKTFKMRGIRHLFFIGCKKSIFVNIA